MPRTLARAALPLLLPVALAACGGGGGGARFSSGGGYSAGRVYTAPGSPEDPWGPYIHEASSRYTVPEAWIRAVIRQESGGHQYLNGRPVTSDAGAMGLMQLMPDTYAMLRDRYGLGNDPYEPHDNIMAGTAYIAELNARYGAPAFLVAYNAGPAILPNETIAYLASVAPEIAAAGPVSGPLAAYADASGGSARPLVYNASAQPLRGSCWRDPNAAYDPDDPCDPNHTQVAPPAPVAALASAAPLSAPASPIRDANGCWRDPDAAYDPDAPCDRTPPASAAPPTALASAAPAFAAPPVTPPPVTPQQAPPVQVASAAMPARGSDGCWRDPNAAYDPDAPCGRPPPAYAAPAQPVYAGAETRPGSVIWGGAPTPAPAPVEVAAAPPAPVPHPAMPAPAPVRYAALQPPRPRATPRFALIPSAQAEPIHIAATQGGWGVQVGAFSNPSLARQVADQARRMAPELASARTVLGPTSPFGGNVLYRARLEGITRDAASVACSRLSAHGVACLTVPRGG